MSKFYVGQRVRIKWSESRPELNGTEGAIVGLDTKATDGKTIWTGYNVAPDLWGSCRDKPGAAKFCPRPEQLEPLSPPKQELSSWEKFEELFGWSPSKSKEAA